MSEDRTVERGGETGERREGHASARAGRMARMIVLGGLTVMVSAGACAQSVRSLVHGGNDEYVEGKYTDAEVQYRKALEKEAELVQGHFNLGNALHKQGKHEEAVRQYEQAIGRAVDTGTKANGYYNIGNSFLSQQQYQEAIRAYVEGLKLKPDDVDAKHNLSYALDMLKQQEQQQQQQNKDKKQQDQQNQDNQNQQQQQQKQDQPPPKEKQPQPQQQQRQMSKEQAERILDVLKNSERDIQKKLRVRQAVRPRGDKDW
jgi:tetratricopeptide (TPR) repeat protein